MKRIYAVIELEDHSLFDPTSEVDQDELAEDLLLATHGVASVTVYTSVEDLQADEAAVQPS